RKGDVILLIGGAPGWLGQSIYLREICGREDGAPPPVDLAAERKHGEFVRAQISRQRVNAVHDVSDGGLLVSLAEMAMASGIGAALSGAQGPAHAFWFGEDQGRYVVTASEENAAQIVADAGKANVAMLRLGTTGSDALTVSGERSILVAALKDRFESWL